MPVLCHNHSTAMTSFCQGLCGSYMTSLPEAERPENKVNEGNYWWKAATVYVFNSLYDVLDASCWQHTVFNWKSVLISRLVLTGFQPAGCLYTSLLIILWSDSLKSKLTDNLFRWRIGVITFWLTEDCNPLIGQIKKWLTVSFVVVLVCAFFPAF